MNRLQLMDYTLERVAERYGDPSPRVFEQLFQQAPELQALFGNDSAGSVRGEMFHRALECLLDAAGPGQFAPGLVAAEVMSHAAYGVPGAQFAQFFEIMVAVFQQALGPDWTPEIDAAWQAALLRLRGYTAPTT